MKVDLNADDPLIDFEKRRLTLNSVEKSVYHSGTGPAVVILSEMPGITPQVSRFARWVRDAGFTVYMPSLFGRDGAVGTAEAGAAVFRSACISAEFNALKRDRSSPVTDWLRELAKVAHRESGGRGVGAVGMCFTGNFALTMMLEPSMLAPVLAQPTLPLNDAAGLEISPSDLAVIRERLDREDLTVRAYRFEGDRYCRAERFAAYAAALGERFEGRVLSDQSANPEVPPFYQAYVDTPHSVVTVHLIDEVGQETVRAKDEIIAFLASRLLGSTNATE